MASSDDDDVPEEITREQGRDVAESALQEQIDNQKRIIAEEKARRRRRNEQNREAKLEKQRKKEEKRSKELGEEGDASPAPVPSRKVTGFLDESIVQFLVEKERAQASVVECQEDVVEPKPKLKRKKGSLGKQDPSKRIKLLNKPDDQKPEKSSASEFLKRRLYGSNVERSMQMIPQSRCHSVAYRP